MPKEVKVCKQGKRHDVLQNKNEVSNAISSQAKVGKMEKNGKKHKKKNDKEDVPLFCTICTDSPRV